MENNFYCRFFAKIFKNVRSKFCKYVSLNFGQSWNNLVVPLSHPLPYPLLIVFVLVLFIRADTECLKKKELNLLGLFTVDSPEVPLQSGQIPLHPSDPYGDGQPL